MKFQEVYTILEKNEYPQQTASTKELLKFLEARRDGAARIHNQSARRSGVSRLTAKHFSSKLPVYDRIIKMVKKDKDLRPLKKEYQTTLSKLRKNIRQPMKFQQLTGELEVLGEVLIETGIM